MNGEGPEDTTGDDMVGMLTVCPTPIGNLDDVTPRQRRALEEADVVACEDTRRTGKLLERLGIDRSDGEPRLVAYHEHNETEATQRLAGMLERGRDVVLVSDAGTPLIADPGFELVEAAREQGAKVRALPGPMAGIVALTASGLPVHAFQFRGFPPESPPSRRNWLEAVDSTELTTVVYESPERIVGLVDDIADALGDERPICLARELTKMHEEYLHGPAAEVHDELAARDEVRGEFTVVIAPGSEQTDEGEVVDEKIRELLERGLTPRTVKEVVAELYDVARSDLYDRIERVDSSR